MQLERGDKKLNHVFVFGLPGQKVLWPEGPALAELTALTGCGSLQSVCGIQYQPFSKWASSLHMYTKSKYTEYTEMYHCRDSLSQMYVFVTWLTLVCLTYVPNRNVYDIFVIHCYSMRHSTSNEHICLSCWCRKSATVGIVQWHSCNILYVQRKGSNMIWHTVLLINYFTVKCKILQHVDCFLYLWLLTYLYSVFYIIVMGKQLKATFNTY